MYNTTGLTESQIQNLVLLIKPHIIQKKAWQGRKPTGLYKCVMITLNYLKTNLTQAAIAEFYKLSQPTVSRIISKYTTLIAQTLHDWIPTANDLPGNTIYLVDGTLVPNWSWGQHFKQDYSGKHHKTGLNLQIVSHLDGRLAWVSDPTPGATHDSKAITISGVLETPNAEFIADKGYIGHEIITPIKRKPGQNQLSEAERQYNKQINRIRSAVERAISHLKNWVILKTDYRRPRLTQPETITAVIALTFYKHSF